MRLFSTLLVLISLTFPGCKTVSYFNTPNDLFETNCKLYMQNGSMQEGRITVHFEAGYEARKFIEFTKDNIKERIYIDSIKYYDIKGKCYYPKILDVDMNGSENILFVRRLSNETSRIQFYELYRKSKRNSDPNDFYFYFISFPNQDARRPLNIASVKLVPNFDDKMGRLVRDCPALADKIYMKARGYFLPHYSLGNNKKIDVFLKIISEYDSCKLN